MEKREHWGSSLGFILAAAGSAIGLGNIWKFPYITGENGGGAFVLVYLVCVMAVGIPVMLCEMTLGRATQKDPVGAFRTLGPKNSRAAMMIGMSLIFAGVSFLFFQQFGWAAILSLSGVLTMFYGWTIVGILSIVVPSVILSYYNVVGGWTLGYIYKSFSGALYVGTVKEAGGLFELFILDLRWMLGLFTVFTLLCALIVAGGVKNGIERWSKILMPTLFVLLLVVMLRSLTLEGASAGVKFLLKPDFSKLSANSVLIALGHAFFTLSLGMGITITFGSYLSRNQNIFLSSLSVVFLDTLVAILAGLAIFPAVFAMGFQPDKGAGLAFQVLPTVFHAMPQGWFWCGLFFILLFIAALTSAIALLEVPVSFFMDEMKWSRPKAVWICTAAILLLGIFSAVSIVNWDRIVSVHAWLVTAFKVNSGSFFDMIDNLCTNWFLPLAGLGTSLFVGWIWGTQKAVQEIRHGSNNFADAHLISLLAGLKDDSTRAELRHAFTLASLWGIFIRFLTPVLIVIAFIWMNMG